MHYNAFFTGCFYQVLLSLFVVDLSAGQFWIDLAQAAKISSWTDSRSRA